MNFVAGWRYLVGGPYRQLRLFCPMWKDSVTNFGSKLGQALGRGELKAFLVRVPDHTPSPNLIIHGIRRDNFALRRPRRAD
jgi:hypothetical protein